MRNYCLNIAGYKIRFEADQDLELMPSKKFKRFLDTDTEEYEAIIIKVHKGEKDLPENSKCIFHAPYVEEINGHPELRQNEFWSIWKSGNDHFIKATFPGSSSGRKKALLKFSQTNLKWDLWISKGDKIDPFEYPLDGLILYYMTVINKDIMIHASGIDDNGKGYIFSGVSGKGKTTIAEIWNSNGAVVIHDDRLIIRKSGDKYIIHNTPVYDNDEPRQASLDKIFLIDHGTINRSIPVHGASAVSMVMANCIQHNGEIENVAGLLESVSDLCCKLPVYKLYFLPDYTIIDHITQDE